MAVSIRMVSITPNNVNTGQSFTITITATDVSWETIKEDFINWNDIKSNNQNWNVVKNYT